MPNHLNLESYAWFGGFLLLAFVVLRHQYSKRDEIYYFWRHEDVPTPGSGKTNILTWMAQMSHRHQYQPWSWSCFPGWGARWEVNSADDIRCILKTSTSSFRKHQRFVSICSPLLLDGIFVSDGRRAQALRKEMGPKIYPSCARTRLKAIAQQKLARMLEIMQECPNDVPFDIKSLLYRYTLEVILEAMYGQSDDYMGGRQQPAFAQAFDYLQAVITKDLRNVFTRMLRVFDMTYWRSLAAVRCFEARMGKGGSKMSRSMCRNFLLAGRDTTAATMSWACYELLRDNGRHWKMLCALRDNETAFERALLRFLLEVMRLHPAVPMEGMQALERICLPSGVVLEKGDDAGWSPYCIGRKENGLWGTIPASKFAPERWIELYPELRLSGDETRSDDANGDEDTAHEPRAEPTIVKKFPKLFTQQFDYQFPVFNAGARTCLGKPLALEMMLVVLERLLRECSLRLVNPTLVCHPTIALVSPPMEPIYVVRV